MVTAMPQATHFQSIFACAERAGYSTSRAGEKVRLALES